jgi:CspA family cold shock protein
MAERQKGRVKWFNPSKGYGFIQRDGENGASKGDDLFVHFQEIQQKGYRSLTEGQWVEFTVVQGPKGLQASQVTVLEEQQGN